MNVLLITLALTCQSFDIATTSQALGRGYYAEANPLLGNSRGRIVAAKVSVNVGMFLWRAKAKNKTVKTAIPVSLAAAGCIGGTVNSITLREGRR